MAVVITSTVVCSKASEMTKQAISISQPEIVVVVVSLACCSANIVTDRQGIKQKPARAELLCCLRTVGT